MRHTIARIIAARAVQSYPGEQNAEAIAGGDAENFFQALAVPACDTQSL
jgi:hypothetical protein